VTQQQQQQQQQRQQQMVRRQVGLIGLRLKLMEQQQQGIC
jgi:hypothetical protein